MVTPGNGMKWQIVEPTQGVYDWSQADQLVAFARAHGQLVRGHTLLWHNQLPDLADHGRRQRHDQQRPAEAAAAPAHPGRGVALPRQDLAVGRGQRVLHSTPIRPASTRTTSGFHTSARASSRRHSAGRTQADPHALLFYNDYNIAGEDGTNAKSDAVYAWLKQMLARRRADHGRRGARDTWTPSTASARSSFQQDLERYASLGLKVAITEADVRTFVNNATDQVPTDHLAVFAQPYEFSADAQGRARGAAGHLVHRSGASPTPTPGCPASSPARGTPRSTT